MTAPLRVAVAGNPNVGKTSLFNELTGLRHSVGNFAGVTVEVARGSVCSRFDVPRPIELFDLPGIYSLTATAEDERLAYRVLSGAGEVQPDVVLLVVDATSLARNLYLALQIRELGLPCVVALNMMDLARKAGLEIDVERLARELGLPIIETIASRARGLDAVVDALASNARRSHPWCVDVEDPLVERLSAQHGPAKARWLLTRAVVEGYAAERSELPVELAGGEAVRRAVIAIIERRYAEIDRILARAHSERRAIASPMTTSEKIDRVLTHRVAGPAVFMLVMTIVFQSMFAWAEPFMKAIEGVIGWTQGQVEVLLGEGILVDFISQGVLAGVGNVIVFVPQITLLFAFIGLLEDSGYMARAAFIVDRVMAKAGLSGSSFVPLLSGFACAIPAIMGTRTIRSFSARLVTMLMIPFVSCSARLPIYALLIGAFFDADRIVLGPFSLGGLMLLGMYGLSTFSALLVGFIYKRTIVRGPRLPLLIELPPYRLPRLRHILSKVWDRVRGFLRDTGTTILAATVVLWVMLSFPKPPDVELLDHSTPIEHSVGGRVGKAVEPALRPMGQDWRIGVAILGSFAAREVFVSTLGLVFGIENADGDDASLRERLREARDPRTNEPLYTPLSAMALMVFFVYAAQCMSTLAVVRRETRTWRWPIFMFCSMTAIAYVAAVVLYQLGSLFLSFVPVAFA
ncbi:MAG: ferrous iron transport protein B [Myxococcota bacterium]